MCNSLRLPAAVLKTAAGVIAAHPSVTDGQHLKTLITAAVREECEAEGFEGELSLRSRAAIELMADTAVRERTTPAGRRFLKRFFKKVGHLLAHVLKIPHLSQGALQP